MGIPAKHAVTLFSLTINAFAAVVVAGAATTLIELAEQISSMTSMVPDLNFPIEVSLAVSVIVAAGITLAVNGRYITYTKSSSAED